MTAPRARRADPRTSHEAAEHAAKNADIVRARVYRVMADHGDWMTHDEVWYAYRGVAEHRDWPKGTEQSVRSRVSELWQDGWMDRDDGETVRNSRGRKVHQWRAVTDPYRAERNYHERVAEQAEEQDEPSNLHIPDEHPHVIVRPLNHYWAVAPEHYDTLPIGAVVRTDEGGGDGEVLEQTHTGQWATPGTTGTRPTADILYPARILYIPEDTPIKLTQFPSRRADQ